MIPQSPIHFSSFTQTQLRSKAPADYERARDTLAGLITQNFGEYVLRIGAQPPNAELLAGSLTDASEGWRGKECSVDDLAFLHSRLVEAVEEIGGKVRL